MRAFGLELFGTLVLVRAIGHYFTILTQYGFAYSGVRSIALNRDNRLAYSEIFCTIQLMKIGLLGIAALILAAITYSSSTCAEIASTLWLYFTVIAAASLFPTWLFQGMERMGIMTSLNLIKKFSFFLWMFLFVRGPGDFVLYLKVLAFLEISRLISAHLLVYRFWRPYLRLPSKKAVGDQLKAGWHIFLSNLSINSYSRLPTLFLGLYAGPSAAGIYALGARISRSLLGMIEPLVQAYFPIVSRHIQNNRALGISQGLSFLGYSSACLATVGALLLIFAKPLTLAIGGRALTEVTTIIQIFATLPLVALVSDFVGLGFLVNAGYSHRYSSVMLTTTLVCALWLLLLVPLFGAIGAAIGLFVSELFASIAMTLALRPLVQSEKSECCSQRAPPD